MITFASTSRILPPLDEPLLDAAVQFVVPAGFSPGGISSMILTPVAAPMNVTTTLKLNGTLGCTLGGPVLLMLKGGCLAVCGVSSEKNRKGYKHGQQYMLVKQHLMVSV
jgi:hypothetical protein